MFFLDAVFPSNFRWNEEADFMLPNGSLLNDIWRNFPSKIRVILGLDFMSGTQGSLALQIICILS